MQIRGVWIVEISELDSLARSEIASIKAFMSRTADRFRPPFGKRVIECPRQCVFAGTVNHTEYLRDETGARGFWPVLCGAIDIEALARDRDQLWAEAKPRYSSGEQWWLDTAALVEIAAEEQAARYQGDPWEEVIAPWLQARTSVSISEVLDKCDMSIATDSAVAAIPFQTVQILPDRMHPRFAATVCTACEAISTETKIRLC